MVQEVVEKRGENNKTKHTLKFTLSVIQFAKCSTVIPLLLPNNQITWRGRTAFCVTRIMRKVNTNFKENLRILKRCFCSLSILKIAIMTYITTVLQLYLVYLEKLLIKHVKLIGRLKGELDTLQANGSLITNKFLITTF